MVVAIQCIKMYLHISVTSFNDRPLGMGEDRYTYSFQG